MKIATLIREENTDEGTFGKLFIDDEFCCHTLELPWRDNVSRYSCIPVGQYECHWITSPKHGHCYQVTNVPGRSMIEIHSANFAGDVQQGYVSQLLGCIALGTSVGELDAGGGEQRAILHSKEAIRKFEDEMNKEDFLLIISGVARWKL